VEQLMAHKPYAALPSLADTQQALEAIMDA
jgi:hypothetical protein